MKIFVKAKTRAKEEKVKKAGQTASLFGNGRQEADTYEVSVKEPPVDGKANRAIMKALAGHFGVSASDVILIFGATSKNKVFEIKG